MFLRDAATAPVGVGPWSGITRIGLPLRTPLMAKTNSPARAGFSSVGYSGMALTKKLGIKPGTVVVLVRAPDTFEQTLGELPANVTVRRRNQGMRDLTLWFTRSRAELVAGIASMARRHETGRLWILWPKRASPLVSDHSESDVRRAGLTCGLVDYKICAVDRDWSGLMFASRAKRSHR